MRLSQCLLRNLNKVHWDRRVWEIGYKGPLLPQQKATGRPDYPVTGNAIAILRERFAREAKVMQLLTQPYIEKEEEASFLLSRGVESVAELREKEKNLKKATVMPGKAKDMNPSMLKRKGNVGTLLHQHRTVEDSIGFLARKRWD